MKKKLLISLVFASIMQINNCQPLPDSAWYLGRTLPGTIQTLFPLDVSEGFSAVEKTAFSPDGKVIYYSELNINPAYTSFTEARIKYYRYSDDTWKGPFVLFENFHSPTFSADGDTLFIEKGDPAGIWYSERTDTSWSTPAKFMGNIVFQGNGAFEGKLQQTNNGNYYCISSIADGGLGGTDAAKVVITDSDTLVQSLGYPLNNRGNNNYLYMARDESYAITYTLEGGDHLEGRALISYSKTDGSWTNPKQMGFGGWAVSLTPDEKYLFHSSYDGSRFDTYWIQIDDLIDSLEHTNFLPYVLNSLPDQNNKEGEEYAYSIPDSAFFDDDGNHTLTYTASLSNNNPLPSWLAFNAETRTFSGILTEPGSYNLKVTVTDTAGASIFDVFRLTVEGGTAVSETIGENHELSVFPNPASRIIHIRMDELPQAASYQLIDMSGKIILQGILNTESIDISDAGKGMYIFKLKTEKEIICRKIFVE